MPLRARHASRETIRSHVKTVKIPQASRYCLPMLYHCLMSYNIGGYYGIRLRRRIHGAIRGVFMMVCYHVMKARTLFWHHYDIILSVCLMPVTYNGLVITIVRHRRNGYHCAWLRLPSRTFTRLMAGWRTSLVIALSSRCHRQILPYEDGRRGAER